VREFKEPYYTGPDCVCCTTPAKEERDAIIEMINQERREWGLGTLAEKILSNLIIRIHMRDINE
jgi:hypothetical protein